VLLRPWCILEVHCAISAGIPILAVNLRGQYDFAEAQHLLTYLDTELERRNPGASAIITKNNVRVLDAAYVLANVIPNLISVEFDPGGKQAMIAASLECMLHEISRLRDKPATEVRARSIHKPPLTAAAAESDRLRRGCRRGCIDSHLASRLAGAAIAPTCSQRL
jgi:hypothetical protein